MINLRPAGEPDVPVIVDLVEDLDRFYGATDFPDRDARQRQVAALLFGRQPAAHVLLAFEGSHAVGLASYSLLWPAAGTTASLYLKELYVRATHRRGGIGRQLVAGVCATAADLGCSRVEWTTDRTNDDAQVFYAQLGVPPNPTKVMYRIDGTDLPRFAEDNDPATATPTKLPAG